MFQGKKIILVGLTAGLISLAALSGCTGAGQSTAASVSAQSVKPQPAVVNVVATTSGTETAYYATLDITVKNKGAEGTILVQATVTQNGKSSQNQMPVFLKQNETHELKLTYPLTWMGGDFTSDVKTIVP
jgi:hypothetical protein